MSEDVTTSGPTDSAIVTSLLSRQDEVIAELDLLDEQILNVIQEVNAQRETDDEEATVLPIESNTPTDSQHKKAA